MCFGARFTSPAACHQHRPPAPAGSRKENLPGRQPHYFEHREVSVAGRMSPGQSMLAALAGLTAYESGLSAEVRALGAESPGDAFTGAVAIASRLAEELRRNGIDPAPLLGRIYDKASEMAYSS
jgi:hypothetical protein